MNSLHFVNEDLVLWNNFRKGDTKAFADLIRLHYKDLFNYSTRFTKDLELIKDCIQDLFLDLWRTRQTISETSFVRYYLLKSLRRNLARMLAPKKYSLVNIDIRFNQFFDDESSIEDKMIRNEHLRELSTQMRAILANKLSKRQQEVIYLRFYMEADIEEIAEIMGINRQSVYNLLHDGLKKLKQTVSTNTHFTYLIITSYPFLAGIFDA